MREVRHDVARIATVLREREIERELEARSSSAGADRRRTSEKIRRPRPTERGRRKVRTGVVVSDAMDKTVLVRIDRQVRHPRLRQDRAACLEAAAHDEANEAHVGDTVRVMETKPISKTKRWRVVEIVERAK